ncbi:branched-chain amino acid ABC transporter permease [Telmatospirillum sp. J64-1]|uniref:branched-chain amino acid ABC transporter permease n=1 Tax=Telmatospirillum sp. J64-1 TaxID=2502183 RepID=UPI00115E7CA4|nr:branched-chain amino acid ABC transporter permease [Telmatospirillum sp. J64-1]
MYLADFLQLLVYGVISGSILALGAIGVSLIFGILRFAHFAHGDLMTVGAFCALAAVTGLGLPVIAAIPFAILGAVVVAVGIDQTIYRRLRRTAPVILLISSFGMAMALRAVIQIIWGTQDRVYQSGIQLPYRIGDIVLQPAHVWILAGTALLVAAVHLFLQKTSLGKAMRAMSDNMDLARVTGINAERVIIWTWVMGAGLAAVAGVFLAMDTRLHPTMGWHMMLPIFAAAILGGIGKPYGAILGGLIIGVAQELSTLWLSPAYKPAVAFAIMVFMLIVRPQGLLGGRR